MGEGIVYWKGRAGLIYREVFPNDMVRGLREFRVSLAPGTRNPLREFDLVSTTGTHL